MSDINDFVIENGVLTGYNGDGGDVAIPDGVTEIDAGAFQDCSDMTSVIIPDSVTSIGDAAFQGCSGLTDVFYTGSQAQWEEISIGTDNDELTQASIEYDYVAEQVYTITIIQSANGSIAANADTAAAGDTVVLTITPDAGYELDDLTVDQEGTGITVTNGSFTMPEGDVTISASFRIAAPSITVQPSNVKTGENLTATFTVSAENGVVSYQWQYSTDGLVWNNVQEDGTENTYTFSADKSQTGNQYRCVATNETGSTASESATLTVLSDPSIRTQPSNADTTVGGDATFTIAAAGDELSYQWQTRTGSGSWSNYTGIGYDTNSITVSIVTAAMDQRQYRCIVTNPFANATSDEAVLTVISFTSQPSNVKTGEGLSAAFSIDVDHDIGLYQWQVSNDNGSSWSNVPNASSKELSFNAAKSQDGNKYRCSVTKGAGTMYSNAAALTVLANPRIVNHPSDIVVKAGTSGEFSVSATGDELSYQWQVRADDDDDWANYTGSGARTDAINTGSVSDSMDMRQYRCVVSNPFASATSNTAVLYVFTIITQPSDVKTIEGFIAKFSAEAKGAIEYYNWQYKNEDNTSWHNIGSIATDSPDYVFRANSAFNGYQYRCAIGNSIGEIFTDTADLIVVVPFCLTDGRLVLPEGTYTFALNADQSGVLYALGFDRDDM